MQYLTIPCSGKQIYDGSVVMLPRFPGIRWIVHWGWYTYQNVQYQGWYLQLVPAGTILPLDTIDINTMTVIDPKLPCPQPVQGEDRRNFITVQVPLEMTSLSSAELCHGKMFRVNYPHHVGPADTLTDEDEYDPQYWVAIDRYAPNAPTTQPVADNGEYEFHLTNLGGEGIQKLEEVTPQNKVIVTTDDETRPLGDSGYSLGGATISDEPSDKVLATEAAVAEAVAHVLSWQIQGQ